MRGRENLGRAAAIGLAAAAGCAGTEPVGTPTTESPGASATPAVTPTR